MAFLLAPILAGVGITGAAASIVGSIIVGAVAIGVQLLLKQPDSAAANDNGVQLDVKVDGDVPESLIVGRAVTAGSRPYIESYGDNNQNCIEVRAIADHPCEGLVQVYLESQAAALTDTGTDRGHTVDGYDGNVAIRFFDGSQTVADSYAVAALSAHPERPYTTDMIGWQRTLARIHYIYNREKVAGPLTWKFVVDGIRLYNPALDDTVGGSGAHRFDDLDTHEHTANLAVIAYNILRGIRVEDQNGDPIHFYGLKGTPAENLPLDNWFAAIAEADVPKDKIGGGTEPQFHGGAEIPINKEPLEAIRDLLKATGGRFIEIGGVYKLYLGAPGLPAFEFDDGTFPATRGSTAEPVLPLEQLVTFVAASYVSPEDGWIEKQAPPRIDADRETELGQRVEADLSAVMVQSASHVQRLQEQILKRAQRQRRHTETLPPELFGVEPGDVGAFNSGRYGYSDKLFEVAAAEIDVNLFTTVSLLETDPTDYEPPETFAPVIGSSLVTARPGAKIVNDWAVQAFLHEGDTGTKRPAIKVSWVPPGDDDAIGITVQLRRPSQPTNVSTITIGEPDAVAAGEAIILSGLAPLTQYEVRARFQSFEGWATSWSLWVPVTTPDAGITTAEVDNDFNALLDQLRVEREASVARWRDEISAEIERLAAQQGGAYAVRELLTNTIIDAVGQRVGDSEASVIVVQEAIATVNSALAQFFVGLLASTDAGAAEAQFQIAAMSSLPDGAVSAIEMAVRAGLGLDFATAAFRMLAYFNAALGEYRSRIQMVADEVDLIDGDGNVRKLMAGVNADVPNEAPIEAGSPANIVRSDIRNGVPVSSTLMSDDAELHFPLGARLGFPFWHIFKQDGAGGHTLTADHSAIKAPFPEISEVANVTTILQGLVESIVPPVATYAAFGEPGQVSSDSVTIFGVSPAVEGKTVWNLAIDGDFIPPPGTYDLTPLGDGGLQCDAEFRGPGGPSGGFGASITQSVDGTDTTFEYEGGEVVAGAGHRSVSTNNGGGSGGNEVAGGLGGDASGGDTNTDGNDGGPGQSNPSPDPGGTGGFGAAAPSGGAQRNNVALSAYAQAIDGLAGNDPAGGAAGGAASTDSGTSSAMTMGGGGSGARALKAFGVGALLQGVTYRLVVGSPGTAGTGTGNVGFGGVGNYRRAFNGKIGGAAYVKFSI